MDQSQEQHEKEKFINNCNLLKNELLACFGEDKAYAYDKEMNSFAEASFIYKEYAVNGSREIIPFLLSEDVSELSKRERFKLAYDFFKVVIKSHEKNVIMNFELDLFDSSFTEPSLDRGRKKQNLRFYFFLNI